MNGVTMKIPTFVALIATPAVALFASGAFSQSTNSSEPAASGAHVAPDNTKSNKEDPSNRNHTADDQSSNESDLKITQQIRRSVMADKGLSTYAHNIKIVSVNGTVTLNGVVHAEAEKAQIAQKAADIVGRDHVVNELKVAL
jgi:hyperosmotically inducible periplasmic protein